MDQVIKNIIRTVYHRHIPDDVEIVERNGFVFFAHPKYRYDPIITPLAIGAVAAGTATSVAGTLRQGRQAEKIGKARAAIDIQNAEKVERARIEKARILKERGRELIEEQKSAVAAGNIRINVGAPLVIEAETRRDISKDIGFVLEEGREEAGFFRSRAGLELATGKALKKKSKFAAISQGLLGFGSIAFLGVESGLFSRAATTPGTPIPIANQGIPRFLA